MAVALIKNRALVISATLHARVSRGRSNQDIVVAARASLLGFCFASRFSWKASVGVFLLFEIGMLVLARDNLSLNVLMLFYPIEAIKLWQLNVS